MATREYPRLAIERFGAHLLESQDLDPIYVALHHCRTVYGWPEEQIAKWLVAYWCFYDSGVACWLAEDDVEFWEWMRIAAANERPSPTGERWTRGQERRHFRGGASVIAVQRLQASYARPLDLINLLKRLPTDVGSIMDAVKGLYLFGDWIAFKVADMLEACLGHHIDFDQGHVFMFEQPREAALMLWRQRMKIPDGARPKDEDQVILAVVNSLLNTFSHFKAPPRYDRPIALQEIETILCKWKSHMSGHYPLWNDIDKIRRSLDKWIDHSELAAAFLIALPSREKQRRES